MARKKENPRIKNARFEDLHPLCKLSPEIIEALKIEIARGLPPYWARKIVGISDYTYHEWIKKGKASDDPTDPYRVFYEEMEQAKALSIGSRVDVIRKAGENEKNWQAAAWYLERIDHEHFGKKSVIDANVNANVKSTNLAELFDKRELKRILNEEREYKDED